MCFFMCQIFIQLDILFVSPTDSTYNFHLFQKTQRINYGKVCGTLEMV